MRSTGHRVVAISFGEEEGTGRVVMRVAVLARFNPGLTFERQVFGIDPDDLEECDLPPTPPTPPNLN